MPFLLVLLMSFSVLRFTPKMVCGMSFRTRSSEMQCKGCNRERYFSCLIRNYSLELHRHFVFQASRKLAMLAISKGISVIIYPTEQILINTSCIRFYRRQRRQCHSFSDRLTKDEFASDHPAIVMHVKSLFQNISTPSLSSAVNLIFYLNFLHTGLVLELVDIQQYR